MALEKCSEVRCVLHPIGGTAHIISGYGSDYFGR